MTTPDPQTPDHGKLIHTQGVTAPLGFRAHGEDIKRLALDAPAHQRQQLRPLFAFRREHFATFRHKREERRHGFRLEPQQQIGGLNFGLDGVGHPISTS